jgi:hypothetical protein
VVIIYAIDAVRKLTSSYGSIGLEGIFWQLSLKKAEDIQTRESLIKKSKAIYIWNSYD